MTSYATMTDLKATYMPRYHALVVSKEDRRTLVHLNRALYEEFVTDTRHRLPAIPAQRILTLWSEIIEGTFETSMI